MSLITHSHGLSKRCYTIVQERTRALDFKTTYIDARRSASTSHFWNRLINSVISESREYINDCKSSVPRLVFQPNTIIYIDHAEDFLTMTHQPYWRDALKNLEALATNNQNFWVLKWMSTHQIPEWGQARQVFIPPLAPEDMRLELEKHLIDFPVAAVSELCVITGGYPEYLELILPHLSSNSDHHHIDDVVNGLLSDTHSALSRFCQFKWLETLHLAKGYGTLKAILEILSRYPDSRLSQIASYMCHSLPAVKDYITGLIKVGALKREGWTYRLSDPMLARWIVATSSLSLTLSERKTDSDHIERKLPSLLKSREPGVGRDLFIEFD